MSAAEPPRGWEWITGGEISLSLSLSPAGEFTSIVPVKFVLGTLICNDGCGGEGGSDAW